jgi:glycosyltransferase involved in cell wall biosynthesis
MSAGANHPLVTIVVPSYNADATVLETVESLLKQTYINLEIIVIDDGSKDQTGTVLKNIVSKNASRLRYVKQDNAGQAAALNNGWSQANGSYLGYLSADDVLYPDAIDQLVGFLESHPSTWVVYPDYDLIDADSKVIRKVTAPDFKAVDLVEKSICQPGPGALFRKEAFVRTSGWDQKLRLTPDFDFWLRVSRHGEMARLAKNLAGFRVHEGSQSFAPPSEIKSEEPHNVIKSYFAAGVSNTYNEKRAMGWAHILSARLHLRAGRWLNAFSHLAKSIGFQPSVLVQLRFWHLLASGVFGRLRYQIQSSTRKS